MEGGVQHDAQWPGKFGCPNFVRFSRRTWLNSVATSAARSRTPISKTVYNVTQLQPPTLCLNGPVWGHDSTADAFRQGDTVLRSFATFSQLSSIDGNELRGPEGQRDDLADAYALCVAALPQAKRPAFKVHIW
jgi:hypothetical protein